MRLWTIHPQHLDGKGLVALWREALLAQKVLQGKTKGYKHHPQLCRFRASSRPLAAIGTYLSAIHTEARRRGYLFDARKIGRARLHRTIPETTGQLLYEWRHLQAKLKRRDAVRFQECQAISKPAHHPLFRLAPGAVRDWEIAAKPGRGARSRAR